MASLNSEIHISIDPDLKELIEKLDSSKPYEHQYAGPFPLDNKTMSDGNASPHASLAINHNASCQYIRMDANKAVYAVLTEDGVASVANACAKKITGLAGPPSKSPFEQLREAFIAWHCKEDDNRWDIANNFMELVSYMDLYHGTKEEYRTYLRERLQKIGDAFMAAWNEKNGTG